MTTKEHNDEVVRKLTERNKIAEFAMQTLGCDERRADAFVKTCGDFFTWDGTLHFKGASGQVAADDPQCTGFFQREYDFLIPAQAAGADHGALDPDLLTKARARADVTAKSLLFRELHGSKTRNEEGATLAALDKLLADTSDKPGEKKPADKSAATHTGSNPWAAASWNLTDQGKLVKALGEVKAAQIAKAAGSHIGATRPARAP